MCLKYLDSCIGDHVRRHRLDGKLLEEWLLLLRLGCFWVEWFTHPLIVHGCLVPIHSQRNLAMGYGLQM